jgi:hypothetical protein
MSAPNPTRVRRQRLMLIALALLFFAPLGLAFYAYYGLQWRPGTRVNHGQLIEPARPIPAVPLPRVAAAGDAPDASGAGGARGGSGAAAADLFKGKWTLLYWGPGVCTARCRTELYNTRQVRAALRQDDRLQRVFVADGACCDLDFLRTQHPDLITVRATPEAAPLLALLKLGSGDEPAAADRVYLVDPLGNLMMSYTPDAQPKGMLEDLKRLLGLSHVG